MPKKAVGLFFPPRLHRRRDLCLYHLAAHQGRNPHQQQPAALPERAASPRRQVRRRPAAFPCPNPHRRRPRRRKSPPGPKLRVMAWANPYGGARAAGAHRCLCRRDRPRGRPEDRERSPLPYANDLRQAIQSSAPPDVCLVAAREFRRARSLGRFRRHEARPGHRAAQPRRPSHRRPAHQGGAGRVLGQRPLLQPGLFRPGGHRLSPGRTGRGTSSRPTRARLQSLKLKDDAGKPIYALELPADFDLWNVLCTQSGHPRAGTSARGTSPTSTRRKRRCARWKLIHEIFQGPQHRGAGAEAGPGGRRAFRQTTGGASSSARRTSPRPSRISATVSRCCRRPTSSAPALARVNGWAVTARSPDKDASRAAGRLSRLRAGACGAGLPCGGACGLDFRAEAGRR